MNPATAENLVKDPFLYEALQNEEALRSEKCRRSFFFFCQEFWGEFCRDEPVWNWHIPYICSELEKVFYAVVQKEQKKYDLIINIPPGTSKSSIVTVLFPAWCWIAQLPRDQFPEAWKERIRRRQHAKHLNLKPLPLLTGRSFRFITGSYSTTLSTEHSEYSRDVIGSEKYKRYFREVRIKPKKDAKTNFVNTEGGQRFTTSVGSTVTGVHAHIIIIDDPINPSQGQSEISRLTANNWLDSTLSTRKVDKKVTVTIVIMQRLHRNDPTGHLIDKRGEEKIRHIVLPGSDRYKIKPPELIKYYKEGLLDPVRMPRDILDDNKINLGAYQYAGQFGQNPRPREGGLFQESYFEIIDAAPARVESRVRGWDLAGTSEAEAAVTGQDPAYSCGVLVSRKRGILYVEHVFRKKISSNQLRLSMRNFASQDPKGTVVDFPQDPGQAGKAQAREIAGFLIGYIVKFSLESGNKFTKLDPLAAQCEAGNVKLVKGNWNQAFIDELCDIPNNTYWDQSDAFYRAFKRIHIPSGKTAGVW